MRSLLAAVFAAPTFFIAGCYTDPAVTEIANKQGRNTLEIKQLAKTLNEQKAEIKTLRDQTEKNSSALKELLATKPAVVKTSDTSQEEMVDAAIKLLKSSNYSVRNNAISALGYLKGSKAEKVLIEILRSGSSGTNTYTIVNALISMRSSKLRDICLELIKSNSQQKQSAAINILNNQSLNIMTAKDIPLLEKMLASTSNNSSDRSKRLAILRAMAKIDMECAVKNICLILPFVKGYYQREYMYVIFRNNKLPSYKIVKKLVESLGEPSNETLNTCQLICGANINSNDPRLTDLFLKWADFAAINSSFKYQYVNLLRKLMDPKAAEVFLELCRDNKRFKGYLSNYPGITQKNGEYVLVDNAKMEKLMDTRRKKIARIEKWEKRIEEIKKKREEKRRKEKN